MNILSLIFLAFLTNVFDLIMYITLQNLPCLIVLFITFQHRVDNSVAQVKKYRLMITGCFTWFCIAMATLSTSSSDLNIVLTIFTVLIGCHIVVSASFYQKIFMFSIVLLYVMVAILGFGFMGTKTNYSYIYSYGYCMDSSECDPNAYDPSALSLVCNPSLNDANKPILSESKFINVSTSLQIGENTEHVIDWLENAKLEDDSCAFVHNKSGWKFKRFFYIIMYYCVMVICVYTQNKSDREGFYQIYSSNKERFAVQRALQSALEQQQFSEEQFDLIESVLMPLHAGPEDPLFDLHIDQKLLKVGKVLGRGAQGVVLKGDYKGISVAVKTLIHIDRPELKSFRGEIALTKSLVHPNIVKLIGITCTKEILGCILEFVSNGTLEDVLDRIKEGKLSISWNHEKFTLLEGITSGLAFLHKAKFFDDESKRWEKCVVHRDLKPANILVTQHYVPKISDFGCSRFKKDDINMTQIGTPIYAAPEVILGHRYDEKCDIYSFAICMVGMCYEMGNLDDIVLKEVAREVARRDMDPRDASNTSSVMKLIAEGMRIPLPEGTPQPIAELIGNCWQGKPENRPSADELLEVLTHVTRPQLIALDRQTSGTYNIEKATRDAQATRQKMRRRSEAALMPTVGMSPEQLEQLQGGADGKEDRGSDEGKDEEEDKS